jgi:hypothetical protein
MGNARNKPHGTSKPNAKHLSSERQQQKVLMLKLRLHTRPKMTSALA